MLRVWCMRCSLAMSEDTYHKESPVYTDDVGEADEAYDDQDEAGFKPIRRQKQKSFTSKDDRRQQQKEWGRSMHKFHKQRRRDGKP